MLGPDCGTFTATQIGQALGISRQAVDKRRKHGSLIGLDLGRRGFAYPAWQVGPRGTLDGLPAPSCVERWSVDRDPPPALGRRLVREPFATGVRAIDGLLTLGVGQRVGLFAGSGVGKSTLLGAIARGASAEVVVVALVGERGREVAEFLEHSLGPEGRRRAVVVVATSDAEPIWPYR